jgi:hypothetical protein
MDKILLKILLLVVVTAFISGCTMQDTQNSDKIGKAMYSDVVAGSRENTSIAADSSVDVNKTEVEELSFIVYSVDELVEGIKVAKKASDEEKMKDHNELHKLDYFYKPATTFPGYELLAIEVNKYYVFYYYMPATLLRSGKKISFDYENGIEFVMRRDSMESNPLQPIIEQTGIQKNSDNIVYIVYEPKHNILNWAEDKTSMYIRFPETFKDYDSMKVHCKAEKVVVE